jgi:general secretion pathway protein N
LLLWLSVAGLAAAALFWQIDHPPQWPAATGAATKLPDLPAVAPLEPMQLLAPGAYNEISARPLFVASRRPEAPLPLEPSPPEKPPAGAEKTFALLGVMVTPNLTTVLLRPEEPNAKTVRIKPGETVGGWLLETAFPNRVVLRQGQTVQELTLVRPKKLAKPRTGPAGTRKGQDAAPPVNAPVLPQLGELPQTVIPPQPPQ